MSKSRTRTSPSTIVILTSRAASCVDDAWTTDPGRPADGGALRSIRIRSARLPVSIDPISILQAQGAWRLRASPSTRHRGQGAPPVRVAPPAALPRAASRRTCRGDCCRRHRPHRSIRRCPLPASRHGRDAGAELQVRSGAVHDVYPALRHQRLLVVGDPHAMGDAQLTRCQPGVGQVLQVRQSAGQLAARSPLRPAIPMHACGPACRLRGESAPLPRAALANRRRQTAARTRRAGGRSRAVPACVEREALVNRAAGLLAQPRQAPRQPRPSCICRRSRACPPSPVSRTPRRYRARSPWSARSSCRRAAVRRPPLWRRRAASRACAPLRAATPACRSHSSNGMSSAKPRNSV